MFQLVFPDDAQLGPSVYEDHERPVGWPGLDEGGPVPRRLCDAGTERIGPHVSAAAWQ